ncbi:MAG: hypothetical protein V3S55_10035 [Nitrospiraceae bacterium]
MSAPIASTFVVGFVNGVRFYARAEFFQDLRSAMMDKTCVDFIDVDGEPGVANGKWLDAIYLSSPESRERKRAHDKAMEDEAPEEPEEWDT